MKVGEICTRDVLVVKGAEPLAACVRQMNDRNVGSAVVVNDDQGFRRPVGIVTDRDVLRGQFDRSADLYCLSVGDVMTCEPLLVKESSDISSAIEAMSRRAVRRAPVVDAGGELVGIIALDDLLPAIAGQLTTAAKLVSEPPERRRARW